MRRIQLIILLLFLTNIGYAQSTVLTFSGTGGLSMSLGKYKIGTAIEVITNIQGNYAEVGGIYHIVSDWNSLPKVVYRGEVTRASRLTFYAYQEGTGYMYLFAKWDNQSPDSLVNNVTLTVSCSGPYDTSAQGDISSATELSTVVVANTNGNVGIGSKSPKSKLSITNNLQGGVSLADASSCTGAIGFDREVADGSIFNSGYNAFQITARNDNLKFEIYRGDKTAIESNALVVSSNGNIGIGTSLFSNPNNYKLAVNGTIGAKAVKVELNSSTWSDFVFNDDYALRSIKDVEHYINENKHLPDIPSAKEVSEKGVNLGTMDAKLLQKIEELTLYVIKINKEVQELRNENKELKKEVKKQKSVK